MDIENHLAELRKKRGLTASEVAQAVGVSRQTVYAIEAGSYVPNTAVALKLARLFEVSVEDIFLLQSDAPAPADLRQAILLPGGETDAGSFVQLCQVDDRLVAVCPGTGSWALPPADGILCEASVGTEPGCVQVRSFGPAAEYGRRLLIAGCDPAISIVMRHVQKEGVDAVVVGRNSTQALDLLQNGLIHVAGTHLPEAEGEPHHASIYGRFAPGEVAVFSYAIWEQGLVTAKGNPKAIQGIVDLARADVRIINREPGAGSRVLLDMQLSSRNIPASAVHGYGDVANGHLAAAAKVLSGEVDCCMATNAAARLYGLGFVSIARERYDFVIHTKHLDLPAIQTLLGTLGRAALRRELQEFGGYETSGSGDRVD